MREEESVTMVKTLNAVELWVGATLGNIVGVNDGTKLGVNDG